MTTAPTPIHPSTHAPTRSTCAYYRWHRQVTTLCFVLPSAWAPLPPLGLTIFLWNKMSPTMGHPSRSWRQFKKCICPVDRVTSTSKGVYNLSSPWISLLVPPHPLRTSEETNQQANSEWPCLAFAGPSLWKPTLREQKRLKENWAKTELI